MLKVLKTKTGIIGVATVVYAIVMFATSDDPTEGTRLLMEGLAMLTIRHAVSKGGI